MFDNDKMKPFVSGDLFLGLNSNNEEIGISTNRHAITIAGARSGKGACVIIPNLLRWPHNALVVDPKGENAQKTWQERRALGSNIYVLDPFETPEIPAHLRAAFNPLANIDPDSLTASADLEVIADGLVKRADPKHAQWDDGAAFMLAGIMAYVVEEAPQETRSLMAVRDILLQTRDELYADAQRMMKCKTCDGIANDAGISILTALDSEKSMEADFLSGARRHTKWLSQKAMKNVLEHSTFNLSELKTGRATVYVVLPPQYLETHAAFMRLFVRCAINEMAKGGSGRGEKCLFILDEFFSLGKMDSIVKSAGLMPSYGVHLWPILQDLGQLIGMYGNDEAQTFFGNADLHQFFGNTDKFTLDYMSQMTGEVSIEEIGLPPNAPALAQSPSALAAMASQSQSSGARAAGAFFGAVSSGIDSTITAHQQADHQNAMAQYQQKMALVGKPRFSVEQIAKLVQRRDDVVADKMFCIAFGSDKLLITPAPFFRPINEIKTVTNTPEKKSIRSMKGDAILGAIIGAGIGIYIIANSSSGDAFLTITVFAIIGMLGSLFIAKLIKDMLP